MTLAFGRCFVTKLRNCFFLILETRFLILNSHCILKFKSLELPDARLEFPRSSQDCELLSGVVHVFEGFIDLLMYI